LGPAAGREFRRWLETKGNKEVRSMKKAMMIICATALGSALVFSALATGKPANKEAKKLANQQCKAEKRIDKGAFKATYGKRAMRTCKKSEKSEVKEELKNAAKQCKEERMADPDAFKDEYGSNYNQKNAFGKCVSQRVKAEMADEVEAFKNAAKECKAYREDVGKDVFKETYGSNNNKKNALGKCVSQTVKASEEPAGDA
jgi:hypothetical protein